jgi:hypothetical protein
MPGALCLAAPDAVAEYVLGGCYAPAATGPNFPMFARAVSLGKADAATGKTRAKALEKARAQLAKIDKRTDKAATKGKIEDAWKTTILGETSRIREAFAEVS